MDDEKQRQANIRATLTDKMNKMVKRHKFDERQVMQVLRVTPDKAKAILAGQLDEFSSDEIRKMLAILG